MTDSSVLVEQRGAVLVITINRPHVRNAVDLSVAEGLSAAFAQLDDDASVRVAVLTGAGGHFCSGMDLKAFGEGKPPISGAGGFAGITRVPPKKPVIAAVEGYALAGGCEIALVCDLIVAGRDAHFGIPEVRRGLVAAAGGLIRLPRKVPVQIAMEYALTGAAMPAGRAYEVGLVNRLVDAGSALEAALDLAATIVQNAPLAVQASKKIIHDGLAVSEDQSFDVQNAIADPVLTSKDALEGAAAFVEKRSPIWSEA